MKIALVSTSNVAGGWSEALTRMIESVERAADGMPTSDVRLLLLLQGCDRHRNAMEDARKQPGFVSPETTSGLVPLSVARNRLLDKGFREGLIDDDTVVAFPDDDCWYPADALRRIAGRFEADPELDLWFCRYASNPIVPRSSDAFAGVRPDTSTVVRNASSNTVVARGRVVRAIGRFDENLGVGTPNGAGEDVDFALHAYRLARHSAFVDAPLIGHRDNHPALRSRYYRGSLIVLGRHARLVPGAWREYVRKIAIGAYLGGRGELSVGAYASAISASLTAAKQRPSG